LAHRASPLDGADAGGAAQWKSIIKISEIVIIRIRGD
jgi:hypothetical protein